MHPVSLRDPRTASGKAFLGIGGLPPITPCNGPRASKPQTILLPFLNRDWYLYFMSQNTERNASSAASDQAAHDAMTLRYRRSALLGDYLRGGAGALIAGLPLLLVDVHWLPGIALGAILAVFGAFLLRTAARHLTAVTVDADGIQVLGPMGRSLAWRNLTGLTVKYFSTKRDRSDGWMTLRLDGTDSTIKLESALDEFDHVLGIAATAARENNLAIDDVTRANLTALAIDIGEGESTPAEPRHAEARLQTEGWDWGVVAEDRKKRK